MANVIKRWSWIVALSLAIVAPMSGSAHRLIAGKSPSTTSLLPTFIVTDLQTLGGELSVAYDLNNYGQVVGQAQTATGETHAVVWTNGAITDLKTLPGDNFSYALGINDFGQVVGTSLSNLSGTSRGFVGNISSGITQLLSDRQSDADDINNSGEVVGDWWFNACCYQAFVYDGQLINLGTFPGGESSQAIRTNNVGQAVGMGRLTSGGVGPYHAALFSRGAQPIDLGTFPGTPNSVALDINDSGQAVGYCWDSSGSGNPNRGFLYQHGVMEPIPPLGEASVAMAINASGQVVGEATFSTGPHAFIFSNGEIRDLNNLIPTNSGWTLMYALGINDGGQIVGYGEINGVTHGFLLTPKLPLIFIPGIAGSRLDRLDTQPGNIWPGPLFPFPGGRWHELSLDPSRPTPWAIISVPDVIDDVYGPLLSWLQEQGYSQLAADGNPPSLFVFPYDWRMSNIANVARLEDKIADIRELYPNSPVNILTHSMGSLLARRYILDYPTNHHVSKLVTVGAPWLGAAKTIATIEKGTFLKALVFDFRPGTIKELARFFPGLQELLPSRSYFDVGGVPFSEDGWDYNNDGQAFQDYSFDQLVVLLDNQYPNSRPGTVGRTFHSVPGQDDFGLNPNGVQYYHIYGVQSEDTTIGRVRTKEWRVCLPFNLCLARSDFILDYGRGDGTVPLLSAERRGNGKDLNSPYAVTTLIEGPNSILDHAGLMRNTQVQAAILNALNSTPQQTSQTKRPRVMASEPSYYVSIFGEESISVADSLGNSNVLTADTFNGNVPGATPYPLAQDAFQIILSTGKFFDITFRTSANPIVIEILRGTSGSATEVTRYLDLSLPVNVNALLRISPQGPDLLRYDSDGDGVYETQVTPTISVGGSGLLDLDPPTISFAAELSGPTVDVVVTAQDPSGLLSVLYSLDGTNFQSYTGELTLYPAKNPILYVFATDVLGNRSSLITYPLVPSVTPTYSFVPVSGGEYDVEVAAPAGFQWSASSLISWITIKSGKGGTGNGITRFVVGQNTTRSARRGTITIAGTPVEVVQDGGLGEDCRFVISPTSNSFPKSGGSGTIFVFAEDRCGWQAITTDSFITVTSGNVGIGNGTVTYFVASNPGSSWRKGFITIAGHEFTIKQKAP